MLGVDGMQALLIGGPLHGSLISLVDDKALTLNLQPSPGERTFYFRRSGSGYVDSDAVLFVCGRPTYEEVVDAIHRSALSKSAKMRALGHPPGE
jgi:hypothetical protein